jgi:multicomponent K+:H+ antiporter subunit G
MNAMPLWLDLVLTALLIVGTAFALVGSFGLAKLSDFVKRLHGPTKATTLGVGSVLIASALFFSFDGSGPSLHELLVTLFVFLTAPVSAHMLIKAARALDSTLAAQVPPLPGTAEAARAAPADPGPRPEPARGDRGS